MPEMKRAVKDSIFTYLFKQPEYTRQLYLTLHPEDTSVTEDDFKLVTLENILTTGLYNDLGIQVRDKLILLAEAQSTFSVNITLRMLMYLAETYKAYTEEQKLDLYSSKQLSIPRPELYVIYTGEKETVPEVLHLSDLYEGTGSVEVEVKVLRGAGSGSVVDQYVRFCEIIDEQRKLYGYTVKAIEETLRICSEEDILMPFLASRQKEVLDIMVTLFDQEKVMEIHDYNVAMEAMQKAEEKGIRAMVSAMKKRSFAPNDVSQMLIEEYGLAPQVAVAKVEQYWS